MKLAKRIVNLFFLSFWWFVGIIALVAVSPILLVIGLPFLLVLLALLSAFLVLIFTYFVLLLKLTVAVGIPALAIYLLLKYLEK